MKLFDCYQVFERTNSKLKALPFKESSLSPLNTNTDSQSDFEGNSHKTKPTPTSVSKETVSLKSDISILTSRKIQLKP